MNQQSAEPAFHRFAVAASTPASLNVSLCTISELVFSAAETPSIQQRVRASAVLDAVEFLNGFLSKPRHVDDVLAAGMKRGLSRSAIYRARLRIGASTHKGIWEMAK